MRKLLGFILLTSMVTPATAQRLLSLDSCRAMALRNNKQMSISRVKQEIAANVRKSARTKYLPHISALGGYVYTSKEISLLNDEQKDALNGLGTNFATGVQSSIGPYAQILPAALQQRLGADLQQVAGVLNQFGGGITDAFYTDTRNMFAGSIMLTQPVFMGGAIVAMNKMADAGEHDVQKMIREGVATRSEGLSVSVKVNEAEMTKLKVDDGLTLSKMLLCQLCGLPVDEQVTLADEESEDLSTVAPAVAPQHVDLSETRPELKMLQNMIDMGKQTTNILKAGHLPQVLLTGGYAVSNPNLYNGFQRKFAGVWNVGVLVRVPIWNWGDVAYKVRAAKGATAIATLQRDEAREKIELQVSQSQFKVNEANKKLEMARKSTERAEENLRTANLGFQEGVISTTTVMEAQTAWLQAQSQKIDAEIDVKLSQVNLQKALGTLQY